MKKTIRVMRHPYAFDIDVTFGTFEQMVRNAFRMDECCGNVNIEPGGSFNRGIDKRCGRRASFFAVGVHCTLKDKMYDPYPSDVQQDDVKQVNSIGIAHWGGTFWNYASLFDEEIVQGSYPINIDWNGKTYLFDKDVDTFCF